MANHPTCNYIKTETTFAGQIGDRDLMNYRSCVVNSSHQQ